MAGFLEMSIHFLTPNAYVFKYILTACIWLRQERKRSRWGFRLAMVFPIVKLLDYNDMAVLEKNSNPFAVVVMAHLKTRETRHDSTQRYEWKWHITLELYKRGYKKQDAINQT